MTLRDILRDLANYEFSLEKGIVMISKLCAVPCKAYRVIKQIIANETTFETAEIYTLLNELYQAAVLTKFASDTGCIEVFDTLSELYQTYVRALRKYLSIVNFEDEELNSLVDKILNDYEFNFRNVSEIFNPVCDLHFELRERIKDSLDQTTLVSLFEYLCYIKITTLAYKNVLELEIDDDGEIDENAIESFIAKLRADYYELANRIRDVAAILVEDFNSKLV